MKTCLMQYSLGLQSYFLYSWLFQWALSTISIVHRTLARIYKHQYLISLGLVLFLTPSVTFASTFVEGTTTQDVTWKKEYSPYVLSHDFIVNRGTVLTIEPGVSVEPLQGSNLIVRGKLVAHGNSNDPIFYRSVPKSVPKDAAVVASSYNGGFRLSSADGSPLGHYMWSSQSRGGSGYTDNPYIDLGEPVISSDSVVEALVSGPQVDGYCSTPTFTGDIDTDFSCAIAYAAANNISIFRFAASSVPDDLHESWDEPISFLDGGSGNMSHIIMERTSGPGCSLKCVPSPMIYLNYGHLIMEDSTLRGTNNVVTSEFSSLDFSRILFSHVTQLGRETGSSISIRNSSFDDVEIGILGADSMSIVNDWWGDVRGPRVFEVNGCGGALIYRNTVFSPWLVTKPDIGATSSIQSVGASTDVTPLTPVIVIPGILGSFEWNNSWVVDPVLHTYDALVSTLAENGYVASTTLFTFPYDWRKSNADTAIQLKERIDDIKRISRCDSVDIVAHSMGGLVARGYVDSGGYAEDVRNLVFLGTPHQGSPEAYLLWENGKTGESLSGRVLGFILGVYAKEQGYTGVLDYVHRYPVSSVQELLPIYSYLYATSSPFDLLPFPSGYPRNPFLESIKSDFARLLEYASGIDLFITNIVGDVGSTTISSIGGAASDSVSYGRGDGTVPFLSASLGTFDIVTTAKHTDLPTASKDSIVKILTGKESKEIAHKSAIKNVFMVAARFVSSILVTSPDGHKVGFDPTSNQYLSDTENSFYSGNDSPIKVVSIPGLEQGLYTVEVKEGTSTPYSLDVGALSEASSSLITITGDNSLVGTSSSVINISVTDTGEIESQKNIESVKPLSVALTVKRQPSTKRIFVASSTIQDSLLSEDVLSFDPFESERVPTRSLVPFAITEAALSFDVVGPVESTQTTPGVFESIIKFLRSFMRGG